MKKEEMTAYELKVHLLRLRNDIKGSFFNLENWECILKRENIDGIISLVKQVDQEKYPDHKWYASDLMKIESIKSQYKKYRMIMELQFYKGGNKILNLINNIVIIEEEI